MMGRGKAGMGARIRLFTGGWIALAICPNVECCAVLAQLGDYHVEGCINLFCVRCRHRSYLGSPLPGQIVLDPPAIIVKTRDEYCGYRVRKRQMDLARAVARRAHRVL